MTTTTTTPVSYVASAFYVQYNVILLGGAALFSLASASYWPLALGLVAEALWLGVGSRLPAYRRRVDRQLKEARAARLDEEVEQRLHGLDPEHTARALTVGQTLERVGDLVAERATPGSELYRALLSLERLRVSFTELCGLEERVSKRQAALAENPPEREAERLAQAYAAEKDLGARLTLHQGIKAAQRLIEQRGRLGELHRSIGEHLSFIEQATLHLAQQARAGLADDELAHEMEACVARAANVAALEAELFDAQVPPLAPVARGAA